MNLTVKIPLVIMEQNFSADVEVSITARSHGPRWPALNDPGDSGEACEWEVQDIRVRPWKKGERLPGVEVPIWLALMIEKSDDLAEAVDVAERDEPRGRAARDPDDARECMRNER